MEFDGKEAFRELLLSYRELCLELERARRDYREVLCELSDLKKQIADKVK